MMHGHAAITLTDPTTGLVTDRRDEDNIVTDVIKDMMRLNPCAARDHGTRDSVVGSMWPLATQAYGGILLFGETNTEDAASYWPRPDNPIRAYASMDNSTVDDPMRGTFNAAESGPIAKGYRWVYDWPTDRGNGEIKSISLTHRKTGQQYWGSSLYDNDSTFYQVRPSLYQYSSPTIVDRFYKTNYRYPLTGLYCDQAGVHSVTATDGDLLLEYLYTRAPGDHLTLTITSYPWHPDTFGITSDPQSWGDKTQVTATVPGNWAQYTGNYENAQYVGANWSGGLLHLYKWAGNASGDATITHATVTLTGDVNVTTVTSPVQLQAPYYGQNSGSSYASWHNKGAGIIRDGCLTAMGYGHTRFWRIPLADPSHPVEIPIPANTKPENWQNVTYRFPQGSDGTPVSIYGNSNDIWTIRGTQTITVNLGNRPGGQNVRYSMDLPYQSYNYVDVVPYRTGPYTLYPDQYGNFEVFTAAVGVDLRYLGTVNNLADPVTKTSDRTMKITYTLTEA